MRRAMMNSQILSVRERLGLPKGLGQWVLRMKTRTVATLLGFGQLKGFGISLCGYVPLKASEELTLNTGKSQDLPVA
jgi:hypothetical protein